MSKLESSTPCNACDNVVKLDFSLPFCDAVRELKTINGRKLKIGSDNYHVLADLFNGKTIDDYDRVPLNDEGRRINNVKSRISALRHLYLIQIESGYREGHNYVEYWMDRSGNV